MLPSKWTRFSRVNDSMTTGVRVAESPKAGSLVPVHVLTGFLGSGKTTLLRHLLAQPEFADTAVVVNEFGEVGLDHLLVREVAEDVVLLSSGCLCCSVRDDLLSTLAELHALMRSGELPPFRRVVVETTGLADPAPILQAILGDRRLTPFMRMGQVLTTVDAVNGERTMARHREARQQIALANRVIVTKTDLVAESGCDTLIEKVSAINPTAELLTSSKAQLPAARVLNEAPSQWQRPDPARPHPNPPPEGEGIMRGPPPEGEGIMPGPPPEGEEIMPPHEEHGHDEAIQTFTVQVEQPVQWAAFVDWLELLLASRGDSILRVKGLLAVTGDNRPVIVQGVQHVLYPIERLPQWPNGSVGAGWIVFIARDLTQRAVENSLRSVYDHGFA
jgi:G3E family GTPase